MMEHNWKTNISANRQLVEQNLGAKYVVVVAGTSIDCEYWKERYRLAKSRVFRSDGSTTIHVVLESSPKGNFLGTLNAWQNLIEASPENISAISSDVMLMSMYFGQGTRLSPYTQALGNCKPRFPTLYRIGESKKQYLSIGELSTLYSNALVSHLRNRGFKGVIVKWGDEVLIPSADWYGSTDSYNEVDAVRFIWYTSPSAELAREKDWILVDEKTGSMICQLARQSQESLLQRVEQKSQSSSSRLAVNLGSLAVSYDLLGIALQVFLSDLDNPSVKLDWDPYFWVALSCKNREEWIEETNYEKQIGQMGIAKLNAMCPDFYEKVTAIKDAFQRANGRALRTKVVDYGEVFWMDFGQHLALRRNIELVLEQSGRGSMVRELFGISNESDSHGNIIIDSIVNPNTIVRNSLILDSTIESADSVIDGAIIVGSEHSKVRMPFGGVSLFSTVNHLICDGQHAIAFQSIVDVLRLPSGGRHTTVVTSDESFQLMTNEEVVDYSGRNYMEPILGNSISFAEASRLVDGIDGISLFDNISAARNRVRKSLR